MQKALDESNTVLAVVGAPDEWIDDDPSPRPGQISQRIKAVTFLTAQGEVLA